MTQRFAALAALLIMAGAGPAFAFTPADSRQIDGGVAHLSDPDDAFDDLANGGPLFVPPLPSRPQPDSALVTPDRGGKVGRYGCYLYGQGCLK